MFGLGTWWLSAQQRKLMAAGEGYGHHSGEPDSEPADAPRPGFWIALLPILVVIGLNFVMAKQVLPAIDTSYLAKPEFGGLQDARSLIGIWSIIVALSAAVLLLVVMHWARWADLMKTINEGSFGSMLPILNTRDRSRIGTVIASLAGFVVIRDLVLGIAPGNPLISEAVAVNVLAGITGSASGGMSIALKTLGAEYLAMATAAGISPELLHRVAAMASGCMDTLPHNGAVISLLAICRLTHRESYGFIAMNTVVFPLVALVVVITLGTLFGDFEHRREIGDEHEHTSDRRLPAGVRYRQVVSAREAVRLIQDGDTVATSGFVGIGFPRTSRSHWRSVFSIGEEAAAGAGRPRDLTLVYAAGQGDGKDARAQPSRPHGGR